MDDKGPKGALSVVKEMSYISILEVITHLYTFVSTHRTAHLRKVNFTVCKLDLNKPDFTKRGLWLGSIKPSWRKKQICDQVRKFEVLLGILL